jgi:hypothetical protein
MRRENPRQIPGAPHNGCDTGSSIPPNGPRVRLEWLTDHDDMVVSFRYHPDVVDVIRRLPRHRRYFDRMARAWRVHPGEMVRLVTALTTIGCRIEVTKVSGDTR